MLLAEKVMVSVYVLGLLSLFVGVIVKDRAERKAEHEKEYEEYETTSRIRQIWNDKAETGTCDRCGCDDMPTLTIFGVTRCVWCAELENIKRHLKMNGTRRFKKEDNAR